MLPHLDERSRLFLQSFAVQVASCMLVSVPALLIDRHRPTLFLLELRKMFGLSTLTSLGVGIFARQRPSPVSPWIWYNIAALLLLRYGRSAALRLLA
jgi:hypothetical protein